MSDIIEMPFGLDEIDKIFEVSEFLENKTELIQEFTPEVSKFLVKKSFFTGTFRKAYLDAFDDLIVSLIRRELVKHYPNYTAEEILLLTDKTFLKLITQDYYFDPDHYLNKDGLNESTH